MVRVIKLVGERRQQTKMMPSTSKWGQDKMADDGTSDWSGMTAQGYENLRKTIPPGTRRLEPQSTGATDEQAAQAPLSKRGPTSSAAPPPTAPRGPASSAAPPPTAPPSPQAPPPMSTEAAGTSAAAGGHTAAARVVCVMVKTFSEMSKPVAVLILGEVSGGRNAQTFILSSY